VTVQSLLGAKRLPEPQEPSSIGDARAAEVISPFSERFGHLLTEVIHLLNGLPHVPVLVELAEDLIDLVTISSAMPHLTSPASIPSFTAATTSSAAFCTDDPAASCGEGCSVVGEPPRGSAAGLRWFRRPDPRRRAR
jgi:hypothetical protein